MRHFVIWLWVVSLLGVHAHGLIPHHHHVEVVSKHARVIAHHHDHSSHVDAESDSLSDPHDHAFHSHEDGWVKASQRNSRPVGLPVAILPTRLELPRLAESELQRVEILSTSLLATGPPGSTWSRGPPSLS
jgi:hypothetical protein